MAILESENSPSTVAYDGDLFAPGSVQELKQEYGTKVNESLQYLDQLTEKAKAGQKAMLQETLKAGFPIVYEDKAGRWVKEMPNGEIIVLHEQHG